ncbi:MAG TPA: ankyrin repeat domain-containing protein, partial [Thermoanaerobaculia bacterium]
VFSDVPAFVEDDDGEHLANYRFSDRTSANGLRVDEQLVEPGARVALLGRWSSAKNAVVASRIGSGESLTLMRVGEAGGEGLIRSLRTSSNLLLAAMLVMVAVIFGGGWTFLEAREREPGVVAAKSRRWFAAVEEDRVDDVRRMAKRVGVNFRGDGGYTALHLAKSPAMIATLLAAGADVKIRAEHERTPLMRVLWTQDDPEMARLLLAAGADVNAKDDVGDTPLSYALTRGHERAAGFLRKNGGT